MDEDRNKGKEATPHPNRLTRGGEYAKNPKRIALEATRLNSTLHNSVN